MDRVSRIATEWAYCELGKHINLNMSGLSKTSAKQFFVSPISVPRINTLISHDKLRHMASLEHFKFYPIKKVNFHNILKKINKYQQINLTS